MSPSVAACAACGHVIAEAEALEPCSRCGSTERTLRRESLVVDRTESETVERHRVEERRPDGSTLVDEETVARTTPES